MTQASSPQPDAKVRPLQDAWKNDPTIPRVVTVVPSSEGCFRRLTKFPDGSATEEVIHADGTEVVPGPMRSAAAAARADASAGTDAAVRRLVEAHAGTLCHDGAGWWRFDGAIWRREPHVGRKVRAALREAGVADPWPGLVAAAEGLARSEPALAAAAEWDADPWRLGTPGGTVDLATGLLRAADPADRITRATSVAPADTADCPLWRRFLGEAMEGDADRVGFLQRFCGYALTGETCEHVALFALGEGGNGKSVFANIVRGIMGTYAAVAAPDLLTHGSGRRVERAHSAEVAVLAGARLVAASETEEGRTWADGRLKLLTGGDPVTARFLGRDPFTFTPRFKLLVVGNHMPVLRSVDAALRRRLRVVPFAHTPAVPDRRLEAKLREEGPAILRWMIEGCVAWAAEGPDGGLLRPAAVAIATDTYLAGEDLVGQFLAECCDRNPGCLKTAGDLYATWCAYAQASGEPPGTQRRFAARLAGHGLVRERADHARLYRGLRLLREGERRADVHKARGG